MKTLMTATVGTVILSVGLLASVAPASALGNCGPNRHRNAYGYCVWGGQNQAWCLRHTGHVAGYGVYGGRYCAG